MGHRKEGEGYAPEALLDDGAGAAMGGLMTTPSDLARFVAMMLQAWPPRDEAERAPALRRTLREMQTGQGFPDLFARRATPGAALQAAAGSYGYGLGAGVDCSWGREVHHGGGLPGFGSMMWWLPDHGVGVVVMANLTYARTGGLARDALNLLHDTGALQPRQPQASQALQRVGQAVAELIIDWQDSRALALAAENLFLDDTLDRRKSVIKDLRADMGACRPGGLIAENALRGTQHVDCERGRLDAVFTLALAAAAAIARSARDLRLAPKTARSDIAATLETARLAYGACTLGELLEGDGRSQARYRLNCERGGLEMTLGTNDKGLLSRLSLSRAKDALCVP